MQCASRARNQPERPAGPPEPVAQASSTFVAPVTGNIVLTRPSSPPADAAAALPASGSLEDVVSAALPAVASIDAGNARGTGFFVRPDMVLTNAHVDRRADRRCGCMRADASTRRAWSSSASVAIDLAVLQVYNPTRTSRSLRLGSTANVASGEEVIAVGYALGVLLEYGHPRHRQRDSQDRHRDADSDRRRDQPGQQRRTAGRSQRTVDRDQFDGISSQAAKGLASRSRSITRRSCSTARSASLVDNAAGQGLNQLIGGTELRRRGAAGRKARVSTHRPSGGRRATATDLDNNWQTQREMLRRQRRTNRRRSRVVRLCTIPNGVQLTQRSAYDCPVGSTRERRRRSRSKDALDDGAESRAATASILVDPRHSPAVPAGLVTAGIGSDSRPESRVPVSIDIDASRDRCPKAPRLRHRHLHPEPAAAPRAHRSRERVRPAVPRALTSASPRSSAPTSARCSSRRPTTRCANRFHVPWVLMREKPDVFHAPHYVLPPAVRVPLGRDDSRLHPPDVSAVPAEPRGVCLRARRDVERGATLRPHPDGVRGVEARHPAFLQRAAGEDRRSSTTPSTSASGWSRQPRRSRASASAIQLDHGFVLYVGNIKPHKNLVRLIEAFAALRQDEFEDLKLLIIGDEISKLPALRRAVHSHKLHKHVRFLGYLPDDTLAVALSPRRGVRLPVALRRLRSAAARSDGERHAGRDLERLVAARGDGRRRRARRSLRCRLDRRRHPPRADAIRQLAAELRRKGLMRAREFSWERSVARTHDIYRLVGGVDAERSVCASRSSTTG